ncbi:DNA-3-methyladenine glycosidase [Bacillus sp. AFS017274]|nr:DNA-3-methyladenine glycosidase [Bacillus sp. AFS017274]
MFDLGNKELIILQNNDPQLAKLITLIGGRSLEIGDDRFAALIKSIIGQQLSVKAAATISSRFFNLLNNKVDPYTIENISDEDIRIVGISKQKITYIRDLCSKIKLNEITLSGLDALSDTEVIETLTKVKGIGSWTAEMFLIFSLGRDNILSLGDVGLQRACKWLYNVEKEVNPKQYLKEKGRFWEPYSSIASLYLWDAIDYGYVDNYKKIDDVYIATKANTEL